MKGEEESEGEGEGEDSYSMAGCASVAPASREVRYARNQGSSIAFVSGARSSGGRSGQTWR